VHVPFNPLKTIPELASHFSPGVDVTLGSDEAFTLAAARLASEPALTAPPNQTLHHSDLLSEIMLAATNYCYCEGKSDCYPAGGGSSLLHEIMEHAVYSAVSDRSKAVDLASSQIIRRRFPLPEQRIRHLREIADLPEHKFTDLTALILGEADIESVIEEMLTHFPGFTGDPYLTRVMLFFHMLHRRHGLYLPEEIAALPLPAGYQVPRVMADLGLICYSSRLQSRIQDAETIPAHSRLEHEIRANAILAAKKLADVAGLTVSSVDAILWGMRKQSLSPHHVTVTTDY
jgi:hypothetical protein